MLSVNPFYKRQQSAQPLIPGKHRRSDFLISSMQSAETIALPRANKHMTYQKKEGAGGVEKEEL